MRRFLLPALLLTLAATPADAQVTRDYLRLDGPRIGFTYLPPEVVDKINEAFGGEDGYIYDLGLRGSEDVIGEVPIVSQFGWQFERRFFQTENGLAGVTEWIPLVGGLDRGIILPSMTFLIGLRSQTGFEAGIGPNLTPLGAGLALAAGMNNDVGGLNVPMNVAAVLGRDGMRASVLIGFNLASTPARRARVPVAPQPTTPAPFPASGPLNR